MTYFAEISENLDYGHILTAHQGNKFSVASKKMYGLLETDSFLLKNEEHEIGSLINAITNNTREILNRLFDERGQLEFGHYLYRQIFGGITPEKLLGGSRNHIDLRIISNSESINKMPWVLLANNGIFLSSIGWSISFARSAKLTDCTLPAHSKILAVVPQPHGSNWRNTNASTHLEELENLLVPYNYRLSQGDQLLVVHNWEQFVQMAQSEQPDLIYYYGHGQGDKNQSSLIFTTGEANWEHNVSIADFAQVLRNLDEPPKLTSIAAVVMPVAF